MNSDLKLALAVKHISHARRVSDFSSQKLLSALGSGQRVYLTYLNPQKLIDADLDIYEGATLRVDGCYLAWLFGKIFGAKIERASFDFSSLAGKVFSIIEREGLSVAIIGGKNEDSKIFTKILDRRYNLDIRLALNGYIDESEYEKTICVIKESKADVALVGMGGTKQDEFAARLAAEIPKISIFTCGAFISQTAAGSGDYYPTLFKVLDIRWLYRFLIEPRTIKRVVKYYPWYTYRFYRDLVLCSKYDSEYISK